MTSTNKANPKQGKSQGSGAALREQVLRAMRELLKAKETIPLKDLPERLDRRLEIYGHWDKEKENEALILGRVAAEMMREILKNNEVKELIIISLKLRRLRAISKLIEDRNVSQWISREFVMELPSEIHRMNEQVGKLAHATDSKLTLLAILAKCLGPHAEEFELPDLGPLASFF